MTTEAPSARFAAGMLISLTLVGCALTTTARPARADAAAPASTPEDAVRRAVEGQGAAYAGECVATRSPQDIGKVCASFIAERPRLRAYLVGRTFSEFREWVFVERSADGWSPVGRAPLDLADTSGAIPWPR